MSQCVDFLFTGTKKSGRCIYLSGGPDVRVNLAQILIPKQPHLSGAELAPKAVPFWTRPFWPHFWGQIAGLNYSADDFPI